MVITVAGEKKEVKDQTVLPGPVKAGKCRDAGICNRFYQ